MSFQPSTQLDAVNAMLATIGEAPIASLTATSLPIDATVAQNILLEVTKDFQSLGWYFNTDRHVTLMYDQNSIIWLASNTASVEIDKQYLGKRIEPVLRWDEATGRPFLYDRYNQTNAIGINLIARRIVSWLDWEQLPETARRYCTIRAARIFGDRMVGAENVHGYSVQDEARAMATFKNDDSESVELSIFSSPDVARRLMRGGFGIGGFSW